MSITNNHLSYLAGKVNKQSAHLQKNVERRRWKSRTSAAQPVCV